MLEDKISIKNGNDMENVVRSWRYWLMAAIAVVAFVALIGEPSQQTEHFWLTMVCSKLIAVALIYIDVRLFVWFAKHRQIDDVLRLADEE